MAKPTIRFKGYTEDWEQRKLGDVCEIKDSARIPNSEWSESGVPYIRASDVTNENIDGVLFISQERYEFYKNRTGAPTKDDVLFNGGGEIGKSLLIVDENPIYVQGGAVLYACTSESSELVGQYLKIYFETTHAKSYIDAASAGGTMKHFTLKPSQMMPILMPSVDEQEKLGTYFSNLDNLITLHQRKCEETKILKKYMLQKMFPQNGQKVPEIRFKGFTEDWEQRKLGELVIDHNAGIYISKEDYGEGTNVIGVGNIYDRDIFDGEIYRLGPVNDDKFILEENDILYGESSLVPEGIARTVCVGKNGAGSAFAWHTRRVKLDKNIVNSHVATLELNYLHDIRKYLVSVSTQTALTGMTTEGYFGATLTLPSVEEQQKISDYFKNLDNLITLHQRKYEELKNIKKFMLQNMFV